MTEMFGFWFNAAGKRIRKMEQWELKEAKRLWAKHADIRTGNIQPVDVDFTKQTPKRLVQ